MDVQGVGTLLWVLAGIGCMLALVSVGTVGAVADAQTANPVVQSQDEPGDEVLEDADEIHIDVFVHENRSATFVVDHRFDNTSSEEWDEIREDVEQNQEAYAASQEQRWNETLVEGQNATDREMALSNVTVETDTSSAPRDVGHVLVRFQWESFAHLDLNNLEVGGALEGLTLSGDTSFQVYAPDGYVIEEVSPSPERQDEQSVEWAGEGDPFSSTTPEILMVQAQDEEPEPTETETDDGLPIPWLPALGVLALLAVVGAAGWWIRRDGLDELATDGAADSAPTDGTGHETTADVGGPSPELLSNEERVMLLLEERGGRIKQQEVVSELDWTEAKTSQVVTELREDDQIEVFRIGRENVLALPDDDDRDT